MTGWQRDSNFIRSERFFVVDELEFGVISYELYVMCFQIDSFFYLVQHS